MCSRLHCLGNGSTPGTHRSSARFVFCTEFPYCHAQKNNNRADVGGYQSGYGAKIVRTLVPISGGCWADSWRIFFVFDYCLLFLFCFVVFCFYLLVLVVLLCLWGKVETFQTKESMNVCCDCKNGASKDTWRISTVKWALSNCLTDKRP